MAEDWAKIRIRATDETGSAFDSLRRSILSVQGLVAGLGITATAGGFAMMIKSAIDARAHLNDLAEQTALTVETLSSLQRVATIGGTSLDTVGGIASRFAKSVAEAAGGNKELLSSFNALGISQQRLKNEKFDEIFIDFAQKIAGATNQTYAIAYATELAGKNAATAIPFFRTLAEEGLKQGKVTAQQVAEADKLNKEIGKLKAESISLGEVMATDLVPALTDVATAMRLAYQEGGALMAVWVGLGGAAANALGMTTRQQQAAQVKDLSRQIEVAQKQLQSGTLKPPGSTDSFFSFLIPNVQLNDTAKASLSANLQRMIAERDSILASLNYDPKTPKHNVPAPGKTTTIAGPVTDVFSPLLDQLRQKLALDKDSTEYEKLQIELQEKKYANLTPRQRLELSLLAQAVDLKTADARIMKAQLDAIEGQVKRWDDASRVLEDFSNTQFEYLQQLQLETELTGATETQRQTAIALRKLEQDYQKASIGLSEKELETLKKLYDQQRERIPGAIAANEAAKASAEARKREAEEWKRMTDDVGRSITDRIIDGGIRGFEDLKDIAVNSFKSLILRPVIQPIVTGGATALMGTLGFPGAAAASGGGAGGGSSILGLLSNASGLFGGVASLGSMIGGSFGAGLTYAGSTGALSGLSAAFGMGGMGGSAAFSLGAALPGIGWALGAAAIAKSLFGGKKESAYGTGYNWGGTYDRSGGLDLGITVHTNKGSFGAGESQYAMWEAELNPKVAASLTQIDAIARVIGIDPARVSSFGFGYASPPNESGEAQSQRAVAEISEAYINELLPGIKDLAQQGETLTQTFARLALQSEQLRASQAQLEDRLAGIVRDLPGQLGIPGLLQFQQSLRMSDTLSPLDRIAGARSVYQDTLSRALGGDLGAVQSFPQIAQQLLGIGRDTFASGPQFAELMSQVTGGLNDLLGRQQQLQTEILADVPLVIRETSADQVAELRKTTKAIVDELTAVREELRKLREDS